MVCSEQFCDVGGIFWKKTGFILFGYTLKCRCGKGPEKGTAFWNSLFCFENWSLQNSGKKLAEHKCIWITAYPEIKKWPPSNTHLPLILHSRPIGSPKEPILPVTTMSIFIFVWIRRHSQKDSKPFSCRGFADKSPGNRFILKHINVNIFQS